MDWPIFFKMRRYWLQFNTWVARDSFLGLSSMASQSPEVHLLMSTFFTIHRSYFVSKKFNRLMDNNEVSVYIHLYNLYVITLCIYKLRAIWFIVFISGVSRSSYLRCKFHKYLLKVNENSILYFILLEIFSLNL
jgi:hypothetical protein